MRRCDGDGLAVFADPGTILRRPPGQLEGPARIVLKNDALPVFWYRVYLAVHLARLSKLDFREIRPTVIHPEHGPQEILRAGRETQKRMRPCIKLVPIEEPELLPSIRNSIHR